jgi:protein-arginine kinase activator protein McsA
MNNTEKKFHTLSRCELCNHYLERRRKNTSSLHLCDSCYSTFSQMSVDQRRLASWLFKESKLDFLEWSLQNFGVKKDDEQ